MFTDNEEALFNIQCKVQLLLQSIKSTCHCDDGEIELADENGHVKDLLRNQQCYASELLSERETLVLLAVNRPPDGSEVVFMPLLNDDNIVNQKFLAKLGNWSKVSNQRPKSKRTSKKPTLHIMVTTPEGQEVGNIFGQSAKSTTISTCKLLECKVSGRMGRQLSLPVHPPP
ncbi:uncharacterized protein LOC115074487 isoform X2 [Rhinatrema bivittatum]|uniref:uncharacterized protein LOC115074487 isoform X2 n=1 Tax=Rhinatrema bivittatum TaxID=194408 RepID=UPI00112A9868|nr:uncharacterized protein LOC115074487 isoform X2 [Rhinatrema bivittatum]